MEKTKTFHFNAMNNVKIEITFSNGEKREYFACAENSIHLKNGGGGACVLEFKSPESGDEYLTLSPANHE